MMSYMMESLQQDGSPLMAPQYGSAPASLPMFKIKRPGARPLVFEGTELAMAMSFSPGLPYWYELNLYRASDQRFIVAIRQFFSSKEEQDQVRGWEFDGLEQALDHLAHYDAGQDVKVTIDPTSSRMSPAELAACAMELRAKVMAARRHYESLIGEFFFDLEQGKR